MEATAAVLAPGIGNKNKKAPKQVDANAELRENLEALNKRRFLYTPSYEIYGGVKGLYDYGPVGSAITSNTLEFWREWFILEEDMLQISTSALGPECVFKASGHVDKFEDMMVKDLKSGDAYRADHLLEEHIEELLKNPKLTAEEKNKLQTDVARADDYSCEELGAKLKEYGVKSPEGNDISDPYPFNLMFSSQIGATGKSKGYFRPETAQGMFVNFGRLYAANGSKLPFAAAQIGPAYRNEIAPRSGLLRVREFTLAEIEHFVDPNNKTHERFDNIKDVVLPLYGQESQLGDQQLLFISAGEAVEKGIINNQTLAYFMARTYLFLVRLGAKPDRIRFRQHLANEMAHYAQGCWDAEIKNSYGWIECVGHADRSAYDLSVHAKASNKTSQLTAFVNFPDGPREVDLIIPQADRGLIGKTFKTEAKPFLAWLESIKENQEELAKLKATFDAAAEGDEVEVSGLKLTKKMITFKVQKKKITGQNIVPGVIEPSFGIGRIIYSVLEHAFWVREGAEKDGDDDKLERAVLSLKPIIAPYKCIVLPLISSDEQFLAKTREIESLLKRNHVTAKVDKSSLKIGKRYARADEIGIPFGITIDDITMKDGTVTFRERDSTHQVRLAVADIPALVNKLVDELTTWEEVVAQYGLVSTN
eukprot:TRINITY_DN11966_c0_g1_i1.p1 TRINITY_DN11966_c0_g1~~TRINITY_DN11966_c0_g1_i1.p1  ORF type:complete len:657 (-),score=189.85 TRINITY_DN11966_c0_g1_i1:50-1996(-)